MRTAQIFVSAVLMLTVAAWLVACDTTATDTPAETEDADAAAVDGETAEPAAEDAEPAGEPVLAVGAALADEGELVAIADLAADPDAFQGKTVRIQGTVVHACGSGCSLTLLDGESKLLVRSDKDVFTFPGDWKQKSVVVEGVFQVDPGCAGEHGGEAKHAEHEGEAKHAEHAEHAEKSFSLAVTGAKLAAEQPAATEPAADEQPAAA